VVLSDSSGGGVRKGTEDCCEQYNLEITFERH
jgi:hypothetical protein